MKKTLLISMLTVSLIACGDDDSSDQKQPTTETPVEQPTTNIGVLTSGGIVSGVSYETDSGNSGSTTDEGEFTYNTGDKITFSVSDVQIGEMTTAQAHITPVDLAEDNDSRNNISIFLQSFDSDADISNGINISEKAEIALKDQSIDFKQNTTSFIESPTLTNALAKAELPSTPVSKEQAKQNAQKFFYKDIAGFWELPSNNAKEKTLIYIDQDGNYIMGEAAEKGDGGFPGVELGNFNIDPYTSEISAEITNPEDDKNGSWGFSSSAKDDSTITLYYGNEKDTLLIKEPTDDNAEYTLRKVPNKPNQLIGSWQMQDHLFSFFEDNTYFLLYTGKDECSDYGIEFGKYAISGQNLNATEAYFDTNGCSGLIDAYDIGELRPNRFDLNSLGFTVNNDQLIFTEDGQTVATLKRVP